MKVLCIGFRAGSQSMKYALEAVGLHTYGMGVTVQSYAHLDAWARRGRGQPGPELPVLLEGYDALVGMPAMFFPEDVVAAFPDVRIVLNEVDPDVWWDRYRRFQATLRMLRRVLWFVPRIRAIHASIDAFLYRGLFRDCGDDPAAHKRRLQEVYTRARGLVPPDRVLVYRMGDGWAPLCAFLGVPVPGAPFPHVNRQESEVKRRVLLAIARDIGWLSAAILAIVLLGPTPLAAVAVGALIGLWLLLYRALRA